MMDTLTQDITVAVDVDETVADLLGEWLRRYNERAGDSLLPEDIKGWRVQDQLKPEWQQDEQRWYDILVEPDLYRHILPIQGARAAILRLRKAGVKVVFASTCVAGTEVHKLAWLRRYGFLTDDKQFVSTKDKGLVRADFLIDDGPHNISAFRGTGFLLDQPHNRTAVVAQRVHTLDEAVDHIIHKTYLRAIVH